MAGEQQYDTLIAGGEVVDPGSGLSGQFVTPGLVDLHTHVYWGATYWGVEADPIAARTGVTTWLDVGSAGAFNFPGFKRWIAGPAASRIYALLNLSCIGLTASTGEFANLDYCNVGLAERMVDLHRDVILGIKARIDRNT